MNKKDFAALKASLQDAVGYLNELPILVRDSPRCLNVEP
jgi:hypothetical protein